MPPIGRIVFTVSGGVAGLRRTCALDMASLTPSDRAAVRRALRRRPAAGVSPARDLLRYQLAVRDGDGVHVADWDDLTVPNALRPLLARLAFRARGVTG